MAKVAKAAKKAVKNTLKTKGKATRKANTKAVKKKYNSKKLYTDEEKRVLKNLRSKRKYLTNKINILTNAMDSSYKITLKDLRQNVITNEIAERLAGSGDDPTDGQYFDPDRETEYETRDFREWLLENEDDDLATELIDLYNALGNNDTQIELDTDDKTAFNDKLNDYVKRLSSVNENIDKVTFKAKERKNLAIARELAKKNGYENAESLIEAIDRGHVVLKKLSKPEQAAITFVKEQLSKAIVGVVKEHGDLSKEGFNLAKKTINASIMSNPLEGVRVGIKEMTVNKIVEKYGNDAGDLAGSMIDLVTGKGSVGSLGVSIFSGIVNKTGFNKQLMQERSQELIDAGKSDFDTENMKQLGADVVVDIAESVIMAGGNIYAAVPIALKKVLFDTAGAAVRSATHEEEPAKKKAASAKTKMSDEDVVNKFMG